MEDLTQQADTYLYCTLLNEHILIPILSVHLVIPLPELQETPSSDAAFTGVINLHGELISVYDLASLLQKQKLKTNIHTPIIVCNNKQHHSGLIVSEVFDIKHFSQKQRHPSQSAVKPYVIGIVQEPPLSFWILDVEKLLAYHQSTEHGYESTAGRN